MALLAYITNPSKEAAKKIARTLLEKRLIACANIFPITSMYWQEGNISDENEFVLIAKTTKEKFDSLKKEVESIHTYKVPCILKISAEANKKYSEWMKEKINF